MFINGQEEIRSRIDEVIEKLGQLDNITTGAPVHKNVPENYDIRSEHKESEDPMQESTDPWRRGRGDNKEENVMNRFERNNFDKRVSKLNGEKGDKGERDFKSWLFDVRRITMEDRHFHDFLEWLTDLKSEITPELMVKKAKETKWDIPWLNKQLYGILSETARTK